MNTSHLKHYKDLIWLLYKYGGVNFSNFSTQLDVSQIFKEKGANRGEAKELSKDLEELSPFYIKLGQILSSQTQVLPDAYEEALENLQDNTKPMPYDEVEKVII